MGEDIIHAQCVSTISVVECNDHEKLHSYRKKEIENQINSSIFLKVEDLTLTLTQTRIHRLSLLALEAREGQGLLWGSQFGTRIRLSCLSAVGPAYLQNWLSHHTHPEPLGLAGNTSDKALSKKRSDWKTYFSARSQVVPTTPRNVHMNVGISSHLERAGKAAWPQSESTCVRGTTSHTWSK
jgi:hypothetical protein